MTYRYLGTGPLVIQQTGKRTISLTQKGQEVELDPDVAELNGRGLFEPIDVIKDEIASAPDQG